MLVLVDAQVSPALAPWLARTLGVEAVAVRDLGLRDAEDPAIFAAARARGPGTVVMTKDRDFLDLLAQHGPPPQVVWLTCGNTSNAFLRARLVTAWPAAARLLAAGEALVEIGGAAG